MDSLEFLPEKKKDKEDQEFNKFYTLKQKTREIKLLILELKKCLKIKKKRTPKDEDDLESEKSAEQSMN